MHAVRRSMGWERLQYYCGNTAVNCTARGMYLVKVQNEFCDGGVTS